MAMVELRETLTAEHAECEEYRHNPRQARALRAIKLAFRAENKAEKRRKLAAARTEADPCGMTKK